MSRVQVLGNAIALIDGKPFPFDFLCSKHISFVRLDPSHKDDAQLQLAETLKEIDAQLKTKHISCKGRPCRVCGCSTQSLSAWYCSSYCYQNKRRLEKKCQTAKEIEKNHLWEMGYYSLKIQGNTIVVMDRTVQYHLVFRAIKDIEWFYDNALGDMRVLDGDKYSWVIYSKNGKLVPKRVLNLVNIFCQVHHRFRKKKE